MCWNNYFCNGLHSWNGKLEPHAHTRQAYYHLFQDKFLPMGSEILLSVFLPFLQRNHSAALKAVANSSSPQTQNKQIKQAKMISHQEGQAGIQMRESELQLNERNGVNSKANKWQQVNICSGTGADDWFWTVNPVKLQNRPPCVPQVYLWPIAVREKRNVGSDSGRNKGRNLKMWQADWQREIWGEESQEMAGWSCWILAKVLLFLVSALWLPVQLILSRYPEQRRKKMFILLQLMKGNTCERGLWWTLNTVQAPNVQIDVYILIMTRKTQPAEFLRHGMESGPRVSLVLLHLFKLFAPLWRNFCNALDYSPGFTMIHSRSMWDDL